jgi:hypothetical protein
MVDRCEEAFAAMAGAARMATRLVRIQRRDRSVLLHVLSIMLLLLGPKRAAIFRGKLGDLAQPE